MRIRPIIVYLALGLLILSPAAEALVTVSPEGTWPDHWPIPTLRQQARTFDVGTGVQETVYEIRFNSRAEFEAAWPAIVSIKTPGAPLRLDKIDEAGDSNRLWSKHLPVVRIYAPGRAVTTHPSGARLFSGPPWPADLVGPEGQLPEYVTGRMVDGKFRWVPASPNDRQQDDGFYCRGRVEIELVVDGEIIDLNRIRLPANTPVKDRRFAAKPAAE